MRLASVGTALGSLTSVAKSLKDGDRQLGLKEEIVRREQWFEKGRNLGIAAQFPRGISWRKPGIGFVGWFAPFRLDFSVNFLLSIPYW